MAIIFAEQSETGSAAWLSTAGGGTASTVQTAGTWSTYSLNVNGADSTALWASAVSEFYGQARIFSHASPVSAGLVLAFVSPNGTTNTTIRVSAGSQLTACRNTTVLGTGTTVVQPLRWHVLQWRCVIHDSTGVFTVKLDGTTEISLTAQDTRNDAAAGGDTCDRVAFSEGWATTSAYFDDVIINDTTGSTNTSYPDNLGIEALIPSAAGDNTGLTPSAGSNYQNVDERPPDGATTFNSHATSGNYDLYNIPSTQWTSVSAVVLPLYAAKSDAGAKSIAHIVKADTDASGTADTEYTGSDLALSTTYAFYTKYYDQQPDSTNWTAAKVNALQVGGKVRP